MVGRAKTSKNRPAAKLAARSPARRVQILSETVVHDDFFRLSRTSLRYERFDGAMSGAVTRYVVERGDSAGILLHNVETDEIILVEQFNYPAFTRSQGWMIQTLAGRVEAGEDASDAARREALEETGFRVDELVKIGSFFVSPGGTSERVHLFYAPVRAKNQIAAGGGVMSEAEDIRNVVLSRRAFIRQARYGQIDDAKTLIAALWLAKYRPSRKKPLPQI